MEPPGVGRGLDVIMDSIRLWLVWMPGGFGIGAELDLVMDEHFFFHGAKLKEMGSSTLWGVSL
jgi:hypothetical protein